jgi:hypothetical protein
MDPGDAIVIGELESLASRRQQIPAQRAVADAALEDQHGRVHGLAELMADPDLRPDLAAGDGHPLVVEPAHAAGPAPHDANVADVRTFGPLARDVDEVGVEPVPDRVLERSLFTLDLAEAQHVGLAQQNVHLHGLAHLRLRAIGVGKLGDRRRRRCEQDDRPEREEESRYRCAACGHRSLQSFVRPLGRPSPPGADVASADGPTLPPVKPALHPVSAGFRRASRR